MLQPILSVIHNILVVVYTGMWYYQNTIKVRELTTISQEINHRWTVHFVK